MNVNGACHCGKIAYEAEIDPGKVQVCHCRDCQILTGTAFRAAIPAAPETFRLLAGVPKTYVKIADSGSRRTHAFCGECGTPVFRMPTDNTPYYSLRIGGLEQVSDLAKPYRQLWTQRRLPWLSNMWDIPEIDNDPGCPRE